MEINACICTVDINIKKRNEDDTSKQRQIHKMSCLVGELGDLMMGIKGDKKTGRQMIRAVFAWGRMCI